jgi:hypothetical protein
MTIAPTEPLRPLEYRIKQAIAEAATILAETKDSTTKIAVAKTLADLQRALAILDARERGPDGTT